MPICGRIAIAGVNRRQRLALPLRFGQNLRIDYRWGAGNADTMRKHAVDLIAFAPRSSWLILARPSRHCCKRAGGAKGGDEEERAALCDSIEERWIEFGCLPTATFNEAGSACRRATIWGWGLVGGF